MQGLLDNGTFTETKTSQIPEGTRIFGSRFIDELKSTEKGYRKKKRHVDQNYLDAGAAGIAMKEPTVQRLSQRLILSLAASMPDIEVFTRHITQAYIQSGSTLERDV